VVWDLYAGSGAIGIEALSRGSAEALFVEQERAHLKIIEENLSRAQSGLPGHGCSNRM